MRNTLRISDAAAIALHAADYLYAPEKGPKPAAEIAGAIGVSYDHLSKVLQRLTRAGLVLPARGPKGGFSLSRAGKSGRIRDFIAAVDALPEPETCLLNRRVCGRKGCLFGNFLAETNRRFEAVMNRKIANARGNGRG